ncbi:MAG TPA: 23S rRNA pseudouridine(1911/1915/1917) synthase RluD [Gammaproteobacteria bacterium]|nr:23S rRNA pseudouridine(1911/1915/1917) synthase RluD [Gammaproteobacteria bacterium]
MPPTERHECLIPPELSGERLDQALARLLPDYSRERLKKWIKDGAVTLNERTPRPRDHVVSGDLVRVNAVLEVETPMRPEPLPLDVVHEDGAVIVINKPAGLVVHPGAGNPAGTLQNALLHYAPELVHVPRAGIVHRLDKDTSGLLVIARSIKAHTRLVEALAERQVKRQYEAIAVGVMTAGGSVDAPVGRHRADRKRMAVQDGGRPAVTHYRVIERLRAHTYIAVQLETGRTHQIRVHLAHAHYPLVGDPVYGRRLSVPKGAADETIATLRAFKRQALHARELGFVHPDSGEPVSFKAPLPTDMRNLLEVLRQDAAAHADS